MYHCTEETLKRYGRDQLGETEQMVVEGHLEHCDVCFETYVSYLEEDENSLLSDSFTEDTVQKILNQHPTFQSSRTKKDGKQTKTLLHYAVAAGFTLFLMMSGAFNYMTDSLDQDDFQHQPSLSEQMMEKTDGWLNGL